MSLQWLGHFERFVLRFAVPLLTTWFISYAGRIYGEASSNDFAAVSSVVDDDAIAAVAKIVLEAAA